MEGFVVLGLVFAGLIKPAHLFSLKHTTSIDHSLLQYKVSSLLSSRNVNEHGESISDLQSSLISIDGNSATLYHNDTDIGDDDESASVMSSVTHWSDMMRQDSCVQQHSTCSGESVSSITTPETSCTTSTSGLLLDETSLSTADLEQIEQYWDRLMPTVSYLGTVHVAKIYEALRVAYLAHRGQMRKSGEPFIVHVSYCFVLVYVPVFVLYSFLIS
jgi:hypothetical protein